MMDNDTQPKYLTVRQLAADPRYPWLTESTMRALDFQRRAKAWRQRRPSAGKQLRSSDVPGRPAGPDRCPGFRCVACEPPAGLANEYLPGLETTAVKQSVSLALVLIDERSEAKMKKQTKESGTSAKDIPHGSTKGDPVVPASTTYLDDIDKLTPGQLKKKYPLTTVGGT